MSIVVAHRVRTSGPADQSTLLYQHFLDRMIEEKLVQQSLLIPYRGACSDAI
jgi:hypothetical protein